MHAWACWRVFKMEAPRGSRDVSFLKRSFHKLMLNFTWCEGGMGEGGEGEREEEEEGEQGMMDSGLNQERPKS